MNIIKLYLTFQCFDIIGSHHTIVIHVFSLILILMFFTASSSCILQSSRFLCRIDRRWSPLHSWYVLLAKVRKQSVTKPLKRQLQSMLLLKTMNNFTPYTSPSTLKKLPRNVGTSHSIKI